VTEDFKIPSGEPKNRVWVISDLQQSEPEKARKSLYTALDDFGALDLKCDKIWYLGDSVEGSNMVHLDEMTKMQEEAFLNLGVPLCYVMGNHDMDPLPNGGRVPFYDMVRSHSEFRCVASSEEYYYFDKIGDFDVLFISDHFAEDFSWCTHHGRVYGDLEKYPYTDADFKALAEKVRASGKKTITVSHYAYPGGNRESAFMAKFMPLPENILIHFYGHAHIGDRDWAGKDAERKISWVDYTNIPQLDIASLECGRGNAIRSAFFEIYDEYFFVKFRNHEKRCWDEVFVKRII